MQKGEVSLALLVYVDDIILAGNNSHACLAVKEYLNQCFKIKDRGSLKYFLAIEIARSKKGIYLCQRKYALDILSDSGLSGCKPAISPIEQNHRLALDDGPVYENPERYRRLIGKLIYLTITRPDLSYVFHILSQFMHSPRLTHYEAVLRVIRYVKRDPGQGLLLKSDCDLKIHAYCDSDWASCPLTRRSLTGFFIMLGSSPVSWKTKKQVTMSRSSAEAEYRSMAAATAEIVWLKSFLTSLGVTHSSPMELFCDNQAALHIAANPVFHERTKHIELDCHFVREHILAKHITTAHVPSRSQLADLFTKALGQRELLSFLLKYRIARPSSNRDPWKKKAK
ncbi:uncharacterized mitochondrial protein AtMg00810-like [Gastrolobium bilobum]|uniref:uncharacterized mitochondrial protein AtMg00810-like n=1 Tax=Gastrolobium bilobum TaxID=150636 RepID=UPI002AB1B0C9|nr:uncharacterized mitochondrial protein AtMg00810-like [Gastrolobium bilobum]